jgi:glycosyltransferase involved in cell wall biosynthesis
MIEVSVILPNYNHGKYLEERIQSIINQTFQDFELIILDDHSQDNSREIIENYRANPKISHIEFNATNSGSSFLQWNKGIELSRGSLIWVAESDDYCKLNFLEETVTKMKAFPTAGIVYTQSLELDEISGNEYISFQDSPRFKKSYQKSYFARGRAELAGKLVHENTIPNASGVLFRKSVYTEVGGADETMKLCGDWFLWTKMLLVSDIFFIAEPLNIFRLTKISVRNRFSKVETFHERLRILNWMRDKGIKNASGNERTLIKSLFNNFKLHEINIPIKMVMAEPLVGNKVAKMIPAFALSIVDRITGKISRIQNRMIP